MRIRMNAENNSGEDFINLLTIISYKRFKSVFRMNDEKTILYSKIRSENNKCSEFI